MYNHTEDSKKLLAELKASGDTPAALMYQAILHSFMFEGIDAFMKMLSPEDRQEFVDLAHADEIDSISDEHLRNYIQVFFDEEPTDTSYSISSLKKYFAELNKK